MAKFYGSVGYAVTAETSPGVYEEVIKEVTYFGDILRNSRQLQPTENLNDNIRINNEISIVADPFAFENFHAMRFVTYMGNKWNITGVDVKYPRLILTVGGVYNAQQT